jgi:type I restriction enzyme R subunit
MTRFTESVVEDATLDILDGLGYAILHGPDIAPGMPNAERTDYAEGVLAGRLRAALERINPAIPLDALDDAIRKVTRPDSPSLIENNRRFHRLLADGVDVEYRRPDGSIAGDKVWLIDFANPGKDDWLAVNQFTLSEGRENRRPDVVVFINGLPLGVIELKNPADENATLRNAFNQFQTYKRAIPGLFPYNELLVISDGLEARVGSLTADWERFMPWRTEDGETIAPRGTPELDTLLKGIFHKDRLLDFLRHFIVFNMEGPHLVKKIAAIISSTRSTKPSSARSRRPGSAATNGPG